MNQRAYIVLLFSGAVLLCGLLGMGCSGGDEGSGSRGDDYDLRDP